MRFYYRRDDLPPTRAFRGLELLYDGQFIIIGQVLSEWLNQHFNSPNSQYPEAKFQQALTFSACTSFMCFINSYFFSKLSSQ